MVLERGYYRLRTLVKMFQVSRSTIYRWVAEGGRKGEPDFPTPVKIHGGSAWIREEIHAYMDAVKAIRDKESEGE